ncbi:MAG: N-acetylglucosamine kinase [Nitritalea sp.]
MIVLADSGASKTDWRVIDKGKISQFRSPGFNPNYQKDAEIREALAQGFLQDLGKHTQKVFFYGAGCTLPENKLRVAHCLREVFPSAVIDVQHDMMAAARATLGRKAGISCILGTGSNSCDYDGVQIIAKRPAPGFILGDEGSGSAIGKQFILDFIHDEMPARVREKLLKKQALDYATIIQNVYQAPFPGKYLASFCEFITENKSDPYCFLLIEQAFVKFFEKHIVKYENYTEKTVSFVGSIAFYNSDILRRVAARYHMPVATILETPIAGLTLYHSADEND